MVYGNKKKSSSDFEQNEIIQYQREIDDLKKDLVRMTESLKNYYFLKYSSNSDDQKKYQHTKPPQHEQLITKIQNYKINPQHLKLSQQNYLEDLIDSLQESALYHSQTFWPQTEDNVKRRCEFYNQHKK